MTLIVLGIKRAFIEKKERNEKRMKKIKLERVRNKMNGHVKFRIHTQNKADEQKEKSK